MNTEYHVYESNRSLIISLSALPPVILIKRKSTPHEARIKTIKELLKYDISDTRSHEDVKNFVNKKIYGTKQWKDYQTLFPKYKNEIREIQHQNVLTGIIKADLREGIEPNSINVEKAIKLYLKDGLENNKLFSSIEFIQV